MILAPDINIQTYLITYCEVGLVDSKGERLRDPDTYVTTIQL